MGNKHRSIIDINLDKPRHLRYDLNALATIEDVLGVSLFQIQKEKQFGIKTVRAIIWAGLLHEEPGLTTEQVGGWIDGENMAYAITKMTEALSAALVGLQEKKMNIKAKVAGIGEQQKSSPSAPSNSNPQNSGASLQ